LRLNLEKLFSEAEKKKKGENFAHFEKRHLRSISYFSAGRNHLLRLRSKFSCSAAHAPSNDVKQMRKNILVEIRIAGTLRSRAFYFEMDSNNLLL
jgi:hypothetical protein